MFNKIALITNYDADIIADTVRTVVGFLRSRGREVILDEHSAGLLPDSGLATAYTGDDLGDCDLAIAIGGDGTMLRAARILANLDIPLLGINRGRLGFLADIPADSVEEHLDAILSGEFVEDERFQLHCQVDSGDRTVLESDAFNDVIIQKWNFAKLIELETYVDDKLVHTQRADGMIVASPTGSTAYALSGGGPILYPSLNALVLVPICPHTLSNRPLVIDGDSRVEIVVGEPDTNHASLTCDGEISARLSTGDRVIVYKKDHKMHLIHPADHDHFAILRAKLHWG
ncbi:MAG TPA: NAD(+) kinase [Gammaproteobacteria bacterium]|nr:NAD(+) kinase [Gammaproteobacteria bacterium]